MFHLYSPSITNTRDTQCRLTWMFFQQLKRAHVDWTSVEPGPEMNFALGALAAAAAVCVMIPVDTIKTRLVTQVCMHGHLYVLLSIQVAQ